MHVHGEVSLSGSNVAQLNITLPFTVAAGANAKLLNAIDVLKYRKVVAAVKLSATVSNNVNIREGVLSSMNSSTEVVQDNALTQTGNKVIQSIQPRLQYVDAYFTNSDVSPVNITSAQIILWNMA